MGSAGMVPYGTGSAESISVLFILFGKSFSGFFAERTSSFLSLRPLFFALAGAAFSAPAAAASGPSDPP